VCLISHYNCPIIYIGFHPPTVSPALGEAVKNLRAVQSSFLAEFYQNVAWHVQQKDDIQSELNLADEHIHKLNDDIEHLKEAMHRLNEVE
jgi:hypothetical protein